MYGPGTVTIQGIIVESQVSLDCRYIQTTPPTLKLDWNRLGRFAVLPMVSQGSYELVLPAAIQIHGVQPVSQLEPVVAHFLEGQAVPPQPPVDVDCKEEYQVCSFVDSRMYKSLTQYHVR